MEQRLCACDCGQLRPIKDNRGRERFYINGHCDKGWLEEGHDISKLEKNAMWNGGIMHMMQGYIRLKRPKHPRADHKGYVFEHVLIYEEYNKCCVLRSGAVHHINHIRNDNRIENLELMGHGQHSSFHNRSKKGQKYRKRGGE